MLVLVGIPANASAHAGTDAGRQSSLAKAMVRLSLEYHYPAVKLDSDFSRRVLSRYLDILDPGHFYFTQQDAMAIHSAFDSRLTKDLGTGNLKPAFAIHKLFLQRERQLFALALQLLAEKPDLDSSARYLIDRKDAPRPKNNAALEQLWKKRIDNEILDRLLHGERLKDARAALRARYRTQDPGNDGHAFGQYMNAFMAAMDPHSRYVTAQETGGRVGGTDTLHTIAGASLVNRNGYVTIVRLPVPVDIKDGSRLENGERILGIQMKPRGETVPLSGWNLDKAANIIRQSAGTRARLLVQLPGPPGLQRTKWVRLPARAAQSMSRRSVAYIDFAREGTLQYKIGVIRIPSFYRGVKGHTASHGSRGVASDVAYLIRLLKRKGVSALLLDMRGNPGGSLREALAMTGLFMPVDEPVVKILTRFGINRHSSIDENDGIAWWGPLGILVNRGSASATEIFCGALKDYHRAIILGTRTWGKGTIQTFIPLAGLTHADNPGELKLTTAEFFMPDGDSPQIRGVLPDITIPSASDAFIGGESAYSNALPASAIKALHYKPISGNDTAPLPALRAYFKKDLAGNSNLQLYEREIDLLREMDDRASLSLDLQKRRRMLAEYDSRWLRLDNEWRAVLGGPPLESLEQARQSPFQIPDVQLRLAIRIMGKFADLDPSIGLEMNIPIDRDGDEYPECIHQNSSLLASSLKQPLILYAQPCTRNARQIFYVPDTLSSGKADASPPPLRQGGGL